MSFTHTILITGGTTGLGYHAALSLAASHPSYLIAIASRTDPTSAATTINTTLHQQNVTYLPLDLSKPSTIRAFITTWKANSYPPIRALLLSAGLQFPGSDVRYTDDGIEATFGINHVGHALLFHLLATHRLFAETGTVRVVVTASGTHDPAQKSGLPDAKYDSAAELAYPSAESIATNNGQQRYATSKLVNILWTYALNRRVTAAAPSISSSGSGADGGRVKMTINAFDPGLMPGTGLAREYNPVVRLLWFQVLPRVLPLLRMVMFENIHTPSESGVSLAWLAVGEDVEGRSGEYYEGRKVIKSSVESYDEGKQEELWRWTVRAVAADEEEIAAFEKVFG